MKISIVTVAYNAAATIADAIRSVAAQDHDDYEHIVVDGASTDDTRAIAASLPGERVVIVSEPDNGIYDAMNKGIRLAQGDLIGFLNADDFFARTDSLSLLAAAARGSTAAAVCGAVALVSPHNTRRIRRYYRSVGFHAWMLRFGHMPPHPGFYIRRDALDRVGEFDPRTWTGADFEWMIRFFHVHKLSMTPIRETVVAFRLGGDSTSGLRSLFNINREALASCRRWGLFSSPAAMSAKYLVKIGQYVDRPSDFPLAPPLGWQPP